VTSRARAAALALIFTGCAAGPVAAPEETESERSEPDWAVLPDFDALRTEWGDRDDFTQLCETDRPIKEVNAAFEASAWPDLLQLSDVGLARCPVDIYLHTVRSVALRELGRTAESQQQLRWRNGLVGSILASGDGKTPETAWVVISVAEEYAVLGVFGMQFRRQSLVEGNLDRIEAEREGDAVTLYFDPRAHFRRLEKALESP
jgi:hypothetical protein